MGLTLIALISQFTCLPSAQAGRHWEIGSPRHFLRKLEYQLWVHDGLHPR